MISKMTDQQIAAKIWHTLYPKSNFYHTKNVSGDRYRNLLQCVRELKQQGVINE